MLCDAPALNASSAPSSSLNSRVPRQTAPHCQRVSRTPRPVLLRPPDEQPHSETLRHPPSARPSLLEMLEKVPREFKDYCDCLDYYT
jgi:hypothetical protein